MRDIKGEGSLVIRISVHIGDGAFAGGPRESNYCILAVCGDLNAFQPFLEIDNTHTQLRISTVASRTHNALNKS